MEALTWADLGTIAGAAAAATLVAQVLLMVRPNVAAWIVRLVMLLVAVVLTELVALSAALTIQAFVVALFVGLAAAALAMKTYETGKHGLNAAVQ